jgi:hypothetical protein
VYSGQPGGSQAEKTGGVLFRIQVKFEPKLASELRPIQRDLKDVSDTNVLKALAVASHSAKESK